MSEKERTVYDELIHLNESDCSMLYEREDCLGQTETLELIKLHNIIWERTIYDELIHYELNCSI